MKWDVLPNPDDSMKVNAGDMVILLGNDEQFKSVKDLLGTNQGR
jgi:K+/H+ antiporter YhaU regulatory subunit KhtT